MRNESKKHKLGSFVYTIPADNYTSHDLKRRTKLVV